MSLAAANPRLGQKVGAVVMLLVILGIAYLLLLRDRLFLGPTVKVRVYFQQVGALHEGADVIVAGREVGKVAAIQLLPEDAIQPDDPLAGEGHGGAVAIVEIDESRRDMVPVNGDFFVASKGIFSDRYLEVGPPGDGAAPGRPVVTGDKVRGVDPPSMDRVLQNTWNDLETARSFLAQVEPEAKLLFDAIDELSATLATLEPAGGEIAVLRAKVDDAVTEARTTWLALTASGVTPDDVSALVGRARLSLSAGGVAIAGLRVHLTRLGDAVTQLRGRIDAAAPHLERDLRAALAAVDHALARLDDVRAHAEDVLAAIQDGEGTIGRIMNDPEFPEEAKELGKILKRQPWRIVGHPQDSAP